jgi:tRNA (guanine26-N2/guanine27-N2)-dimethyltransferase
MTGRTDFPKELGIRVLITFILKDLARYDFTFEPLYSHANHYFRVIGRIAYGPDKNLSRIRFVSYCPKCHSKTIGIEKACSCGGKMDIIGPLWTGGIQDKDFITKLISKFSFGNSRELSVASQEIDSPFYYDLHKIAGSLKIGCPKMERVIDNLRKKGFKASRTHLCGTGLKTDAHLKEILKNIST